MWVHIACLNSFYVLTYPSVYTHQGVSAHSLILSMFQLIWTICLHFPGSECPFIIRFFPCPNFTLQSVSAPHFGSFYVLSFIHLHSPVCKYPSLAYILSVSWLIWPSSLIREWVPLTWSDSIHTLTCVSIWGSPASGCPLLCILFISNLSICFNSVGSETLACLHLFHILNCLFIHTL